MKKVILSLLTSVSLVLAMYALTCTNKNLHHSYLSNIEALANGEGGSGSYTCETKITTKEDVSTFMCGPCDWVTNAAEAWDSSTKTCKK